jgi:Bacterial extracellular solute-binding proteins, family 3
MVSSEQFPLGSDEQRLIVSYASARKRYLWRKWRRDMPDEPSKKWRIERRVGPVEVLIGILGIAAAVFLTKDAREQMRPYWLPAGEILLIAFFVVLVVAALRRTRGLEKTQKELQESNTRANEVSAKNEELKKENETLKQRGIKELRGRWETVTKITYGHLAYKPFLDYDDKDDPIGLGVDWLKQLLDYSLEGRTVVLDNYPDGGTWGNIFQGLIDKAYDVVATPLFATFDRSRQVAFTTPLFFSNVGLYVSKTTSQLPAWGNIKTSDLKSAIAQAGKLEFLGVKGEISEKLAKKYFDKDKDTIQVSSGKVVPKNLFKDIAGTKVPQGALFCESYYAHLQPLVQSGEVVNVLPRHQILYPVCFAVRLGDYQLLNLLNVRLLEFARNGGAIPKLVNKISNGGDPNLDLNRVKEHFVAEWPCSVHTEKVSHA